MRRCGVAQHGHGAAPATGDGAASSSSTSSTNSTRRWPRYAHCCIGNVAAAGTDRDAARRASAGLGARRVAGGRRVWRHSCSAAAGKGDHLSRPPPEVRIIACDVDGSLLNSQQELTPGVADAVCKAANVGVPVFVATGKARGPWTAEVLPRLGCRLPGVFLQGLAICDAEGRLLHSGALQTDVVRRCVLLAQQLGVTLTAYAGSHIYCARTDEFTEVLKFYKEPTPEPVGDLLALAAHTPIQKCLFMTHNAGVAEIRATVEAELGDVATVTTAVPGMLEVLPVGASKGKGVAWLLQHLGMSPQHLLAIGDGENDAGMLQLARVGVAMGNASGSLKSIADAVVATNDEDGVAEAIDRFVLEPRNIISRRSKQPSRIG